MHCSIFPVVGVGVGVDPANLLLCWTLYVFGRSENDASLEENEYVVLCSAVCVVW